MRNLVSISMAVGETFFWWVEEMGEPALALMPFDPSWKGELQCSSDFGLESVNYTIGAVA